METQNTAGSQPAAPTSSSIPKWLIPLAIVVIIIIILMKVMKRGLGFGKSPEAQLAMANVREGRSISRAEKREDRQDRKDTRMSIRMLKKERRACRKATRGIKRRGGKRRKAKAECQKRFAEQVALLRSDMTSQEAASDKRLASAFSSSGMGADGSDGDD